MIEYKYGWERDIFTENGHTMSKEDILTRLKRLAYVEEKLTPNNMIAMSEESLKKMNYESYREGYKSAVDVLTTSYEAVKKETGGE